MKTIITKLPCIRLTISVWDGYLKSYRKRSKICHNADTAAEFYALSKTSDWWGHKAPKGSDRYDARNSQHERRKRRSLKIFKNYLP